MNLFRKVINLFKPKKVQPKIDNFGWKRDIPDFRDFRFKISVAHELPPSVDLRLKCPPVYNQGDLGSCHDDKTEALTIDGWKFFKEIVKTDKLASVDPETKNLIFEYPNSITSYAYNGRMIKSNHKNLDFFITPNHKMLVRKWLSNDVTLSEKYELIESQNLGWYSGLLNYIHNIGETDNSVYIIKGVEHKQIPQRSERIFPMNYWLEFLGIFVAEGTLLKDKYKIQLAATKEREKDYIRTLLNELNIHALELKDRFTFGNKQIYTELSNLGFLNIKAHQKFVPEFIFKLSDENIKNFLMGHKMGDGCEDDGLWSHYTSSKQLANDLQRLIFLSGQWGSLSERPPRTSKMKDDRIVKGNYPAYRISCWKTFELSIERKTHIIDEEYDGMVYCAEVPTYHTLVTRRNGKMLISGNCTANALGSAFQFEQIKQEKDNFIPSRLFIYYNERAMEGTINQDAGAQIRNGIKTMTDMGVCPETMWEYKDSEFKKKPNPECYTSALDNQVLEYLRISPHTLYEVKHCLSDGYPVSFGFMIYESMMTDQVKRTGIVPVPKLTEQPIGGHAVCFTKDTKISLLDGRELNFDELINEFGNEKSFDVYSCDENGNVVRGVAHSPRKTEHNQEILKITLDNGEIIKSTKYHQFLLRDNS